MNIDITENVGLAGVSRKTSTLTRRPHPSIDEMGHTIDPLPSRSQSQPQQDHEE